MGEGLWAIGYGKEENNIALSCESERVGCS
jgi:hypothetical protein